ncbi:adhesion G-protein coupled receptor G7 isoform X2 [Nycticebus coucang]|uniref:adhesion G-protein coupled receptor G7 isoform X2 n=1 Tax=Nycticebus coucang TaxID=9470 RepID=UPI00234C31D5|nr:adhesion G-protein coupled receptor G7 isoform X2 [Nycticebus coucang]
MASCHTCNLRVLVAVVCGLLTAVVIGLGIWRIFIRIQQETWAPPSSTPIEFCRNGGTWSNGRCICTEEWKGLRCTIANFCENSTYMNLTFGRIPVGRYGLSLQVCGSNTANAGSPMAIRLCSVSEYGEIQLQNVMYGNCDENLQTLEKQVENATEFNFISTEAQILTSDGQKLTAEDVTSATRVVAQIFNTSKNASPEAKKVAVTTVSQLLDAHEDVFQRAVAAAGNDKAFTMLIEQMENYSLSLGNELVVEPNVAIQSVNFTSEGTVGPASVRFSVHKGTSDSLVSGSTSIDTNVDSLNPDGQTELQILVNTSKSTTKACGFVVYQNNKLFQSKTFITKSNFSQKIISSKTDENEEVQHASVEMVFSPRYNLEEFQLHSYACVFWNFSMNDWDTYGCDKVKGPDGFLQCHCNHTTNFAVLMTFKKNYQYPASLDTLSNVGCALSIFCLAFTIIFQIVTSCWLAIPTSSDFIKSPLLWSFLIPITIILISNVVIFIIITVKVLWKNNQNLTSTKKISFLKKTVSTLSIAVVFGITWVLAYLMLIENNDIRNVFSYIFCVFNTTQGLQIFLLYTVRTKIFQSRASQVLKSLSTSAGRVTSLPSVTLLRLRVRMYNMLPSFTALHERFRLLEPFATTEEETLTYSDGENSGI